MFPRPAGHLSPYLAPLVFPSVGPDTKNALYANFLLPNLSADCAPAPPDKSRRRYLNCAALTAADYRFLFCNAASLVLPGPPGDGRLPHVALRRRSRGRPGVAARHSARAGILRLLPQPGPAAATAPQPAGGRMGGHPGGPRRLDDAPRAGQPGRRQAPDSREGPPSSGPAAVRPPGPRPARPRRLPGEPVFSGPQPQPRRTSGWRPRRNRSTASRKRPSTSATT